MGGAPLVTYRDCVIDHDGDSRLEEVVDEDDVTLVAVGATLEGGGGGGEGDSRLEEQGVMGGEGGGEGGRGSQSGGQVQRFGQHTHTHTCGRMAPGCSPVWQGFGQHAQVRMIHMVRRDAARCGLPESAVCRECACI